VIPQSILARPPERGSNCRWLTRPSPADNGRRTPPGPSEHPASARKRVSAYQRQGVSAFAYRPKVNIGERISLYFLSPAELKMKKSDGRRGKRIGVGEAYRRGGRRIGVSVYRRVGVSACRRVGVGGSVSACRRRRSVSAVWLVSGGASVS
jgi:hypothetical protein